MSEPKIRIQVNVYDDGTVVGSNDENEGGVLLEFDDFVRAIQGLTSWAANLLTETNEESAKEIGSAMLIATLHEWTFAEEHQEDEDLSSEEPDEDGFGDEDPFPPSETP
jgi:hypothetical protein